MVENNVKKITILKNYKKIQISLQYSSATLAAGRTRMRLSAVESSICVSELHVHLLC